MKNSKPIIFLVAVAAVLIAIVTATVVIPPQVERYHRKQEEPAQTIARLSHKISMLRSACGRIDLVPLQRTCRQTVADTYPYLQTIRAGAAAAAVTGDEQLWVRAMDVTRNVWTAADGLLKAIEDHEARQKKSPASLRGQGIAGTKVLRVRD